MSATNPFNNRRILITGGAGFIGANLVRRFLSLGVQVHVLKRPHSSLWRLQEVIDSIRLYDADICDEHSLKQAFEIINPDIVYHLATPRGGDAAAWSRMIQCNITAALNLIEQLSQKPATRLIVAGSSMEYGPNEQPHREQDVLNPNTWHGVSKAAANLIYRQAAESMGLNIIQLRLFHVYGPWESSHRLLPSAIHAAFNHTPLPLTQATIRRDWVYIDDVIEALLGSTFISTQGASFNIGSATEQSNEDVVNVVEELTGSAITRIAGGFLPGACDSAHRYPDISKAYTTFGWQPKVDFRAGVSAMLKWSRDNPNYWRQQNGSRPLHV